MDWSRSCRFEFIEACSEWIELSGAIAAFDHAPGGFGELLRSALDRIPAIGVGLDFRPHGAAHQAVNRLVESLPDDVPAGHLDHRDPAHRDFAGPAVVVQSHVVDDEFAVERILADHIAGSRFGEVAEECLGVVDHAHFAEAGEPFIGLNDNESEIAPRGTHDQRADIGDLHGSAAGIRAGIRGEDIRVGSSLGEAWRHRTSSGARKMGEPVTNGLARVWMEDRK
ncbi:MAG: hypothetical protein QM757_08550 [Paludibaculum sp.]